MPEKNQYIPESEKEKPLQESDQIPEAAADADEVESEKEKPLQESDQPPEAAADEVEYVSEKTRAFIDSLNEEERKLVYAMTCDMLPNQGTVSEGAVLHVRHQMFEKIIKEDAVQAYLNLGHKVTRGLGNTILHPETGQPTKVTQETWRLGPRGQWYDRWDSVLESLQEKIANY